MGATKKVSENNITNSTVHALTSARDFVLHLYIYEGSSIAPIKTKVEIEVPRVNKIVTTDNSYMFYYFDSLVAEFSKLNVIGYVAK